MMKHEDCKEKDQEPQGQHIKQELYFYVLTGMCIFSLIHYSHFQCFVSY